jgi:DNA-binding response OmpR family regulator
MKRILLVEDDPNTLEGLIVLLSHDGYWVRGASSGRQALQLIETAPFDAVLCDYSLPDMDGLRVCRELRERCSGLMIFLITAYNNVELSKSALASGVAKILYKPLDLDELYRTLFTLSSPPVEERISC